MSREQERIRKKLEDNPIVECNKIQRRFYPELFSMFGKVNDPHHQSYIDYSARVMLGAFSGIVMLIVISMLLVSTLKKKNWIYDKLLYLGRNTIIILYLHRWFDGIDKLLIIPMLGIGNQTMLLYCWQLLMVIVFLILALPLLRFMNHYAWFLFGKKKPRHRRGKTFS